MRSRGATATSDCAIHRESRLGHFQRAAGLWIEAIAGSIRVGPATRVKAVRSAVRLPVNQGDEDREPATAVIEEMKRKGRAGEGESFAANQELEEVAIQGEDRGQAACHADRRPGRHDRSREPASNVKPVKATQAF